MVAAALPCPWCVPALSRQPRKIVDEVWCTMRSALGAIAMATVMAAQDGKGRPRGRERRSRGREVMREGGEVTRAGGEVTRKGGHCGKGRPCQQTAGATAFRVPKLFSGLLDA